MMSQSISGSTGEVVPRHGRRRAAGCAAGLFTALLAPAVHAEDAGPKQMDWNQPVQCLRDGKDQVWRVQCDAQTKICLYAPDAEVDSEGARLRPLERMPDCASEGPFDQDALRADGYRLEQGLPPTPFGWYRDRYGKVLQYNFDLHRRMFVGGAWAPEIRGGEQHTSRSLIDFGLLEWQHYDPTDRNPTRHRLRLVEGELRFAPFWATGYLIRYDVSVRRRDPLLRLTTFFGEPRRFDIRSRLGLFFEGMGLEVRDTPAGNATSVRYLTADVTFDLWQSSDLYSFIRLRGGGLVESLRIPREAGQPAPRNDVRSMLTPNAALDIDLTLDRNGFHHVTGLASYEAPQVLSDHRGEPGSYARYRGELGYEVIALALNDQPISLRFATSASRRDDIPGFTSGWNYSATAGLRFSLWAPARVR